jgi:hypothetical protein
MTTLNERELFSMAFNSGIAAITQVMQDFDGLKLKALVEASHTTSLAQLSELLEQPTEDVALFLQPYVQALQDTVDGVVEENERYE